MTIKWEEERDKWILRKEESNINEQVNISELDDFKELPIDDLGQLTEIQDVLRQRGGPYPRFEAYYQLEEIIDQYMYMWFEESTSSD